MYLIGVSSSLSTELPNMHELFLYGWFCERLEWMGLGWYHHATYLKF